MTATRGMGSFMLMEISGMRWSHVFFQNQFNKCFTPIVKCRKRVGTQEVMPILPIFIILHSSSSSSNIIHMCTIKNSLLLSHPYAFANTFTASWKMISAGKYTWKNLTHVQLKHEWSDSFPCHGRMSWPHLCVYMIVNIWFPCRG